MVVAYDAVASIMILKCFRVKVALSLDWWPVITLLLMISVVPNQKMSTISFILLHGSCSARIHTADMLVSDISTRLPIILWRCMLLARGRNEGSTEI